MNQPCILTYGCLSSSSSPPLLLSPLLLVSGQVGTADGPQWSLGGDTWVVGCAIPDTVVFPQFTELNPDMKDPR